MNAREESENRLSKVRDVMREKGLQTLLIFDSGRHNFLRMNYVAYLTDFISVGPQTVLVLPLEAVPVLYLAPVWDIPRAQDESWVPDVRPFKEFWNRLANFSGKVGLIGRESMHVDFYDDISKVINNYPVYAKDIFKNIDCSQMVSTQ